MHSDKQREQGGHRPESTEEGRRKAEVGRLISERNRAEVEEYPNTMETMRQMTEELRQTRDPHAGGTRPHCHIYPLMSRRKLRPTTDR